MKKTINNVDKNRLVHNYLILNVSEEISNEVHKIPLSIQFSYQIVYK